MPIITPAILAASAKDFVENYQKISFAPRIHVDFADNDFVEGRTFALTDCVLPNQDIDWVAHLMLADGPHRIEAAIDRGFKEVVVHLETIALIETREEMIGLTSRFKQITFAINPDSPISPFRPFLKFMRKLLFLTVVPGRQGGSLQPQVLDLARTIHHDYPHLEIGLDGAMNKKTLPDALSTGAEEFVVGSAIIGAADPRQGYEELVTLIA